MWPLESIPGACGLLAALPCYHGLMDYAGPRPAGLHGLPSHGGRAALPGSDRVSHAWKAVVGHSNVCSETVLMLIL